MLHLPINVPRVPRRVARNLLPRTPSPPTSKVSIPHTEWNVVCHYPYPRTQIHTNPEHTGRSTFPGADIHRAISLGVDLDRNGKQLGSKIHPPFYINLLNNILTKVQHFPMITPITKTSISWTKNAMAKVGSAGERSPLLEVGILMENWMQRTTCSELFIYIIFGRRLMGKGKCLLYIVVPSIIRRELKRFRGVMLGRWSHRRRGLGEE